MDPVRKSFKKFDQWNSRAVHGLDIQYLNFNWEEMNIDVEKSAAIIREHKPKLLLFGGSVFLFPHPVKELSEVAREVGAKVMFDADSCFRINRVWVFPRSS